MNPASASLPPLHPSTVMVFRMVFSFEFFVLACIAVLSPDNVVGNHPLLRSFVGAMSDMFPTIGAYAKKSQFPQVTALYFSVGLVFSLTAAAWLAFAEFPRLRHVLRDFSEIPLRMLTGRLILQSLVFSAFGILGGVYWLVSDADFHFGITPISSSRPALAVFGWLYAGFAPVFMVASGLYLILACALVLRVRARSRKTIVP